jgi:hypothetical protein
MKDQYEGTIRAQHGLISKLVVESDPDMAYKKLLAQKLRLLEELLF